MKRATGLLLILLMLFAVSRSSSAAVAVFFGDHLENRGEIDYNGVGDSGRFESGLASLSYAQETKWVITYQFGEFYDGYFKKELDFFDIQVGYPIANDQSGLLYLTITAINYSGFKGSGAIPDIWRHEADGGLLGFEVVGFLADKLQFEFSFRRSVVGSFRLNDDQSSLNLSLLKLKIQYLLTDYLGLVLLYQLKDFNADAIAFNLSEEFQTTHWGLIYRF